MLHKTHLPATLAPLHRSGCFLPMPRYHLRFPRPPGPLSEPPLSCSGLHLVWWRRLLRGEPRLQALLGRNGANPASSLLNPLKDTSSEALTSQALWKVYLDPRHLSKVSRLGLYEPCDPELIPQPSSASVSSSVQLGWFHKAVVRII